MWILDLLPSLWNWIQIIILLKSYQRDMNIQKIWSILNWLVKLFEFIDTLYWDGCHHLLSSLYHYHIDSHVMKGLSKVELSGEAAKAHLNWDFMYQWGTPEVSALYAFPRTSGVCIYGVLLYQSVFHPSHSLMQIRLIWS